MTSPIVSLPNELLQKIFSYLSREAPMQGFGSDLDRASRVCTLFRDNVNEVHISQGRVRVYNWVVGTLIDEEKLKYTDKLKITGTAGKESIEIFKKYAIRSVEIFFGNLGLNGIATIVPNKLFAAIATLPLLCRVAISFATINKEALTHLATIPVLKFESVKVLDEKGIQLCLESEIGRCSLLQTLILRRCEINPENLKSLSLLKNLKQISLMDAEFLDADEPPAWIFQLPRDFFLLFAIQQTGGRRRDFIEALRHWYCNSSGDLKAKIRNFLSNCLQSTQVAAIYKEQLFALMILQKDVELVKTALESGVDVNCKILPQGRTALHHCICTAYDAVDFDLIRLFLENGADPTLADNRGSTALFDALLLDNTYDIIEKLLLANPAAISCSLLISAAERLLRGSFIDGPLLPIQSDFTLNYSPTTPALSYSYNQMRSNNISEIKRKRFVFTDSISYCSPLLFALTFYLDIGRKGQIELLRIIDLLISKGGAAFKDDAEYSLLHYLAFTSREIPEIAVVESLIKSGIDINAKSKFGTTALDLLLQSIFTAVSHKEYTLIFWKQKFALLKLFIDSGARFNPTTQFLNGGKTRAEGVTETLSRLFAIAYRTNQNIDFLKIDSGSTVHY